jgi:hypothetical protein
MGRVRSNGQPLIDRPGGSMPMLRPHYPARIARQLHDLAERRPPWAEYLRERARILEGL